VKRVYVLGEIMVDVHVALEAPIHVGSDSRGQISFLSGGSAANTATWLAHGGVPTTLIARVGDDAAGWDERRVLQSYGVDLVVSMDTDETTGACVVLVHQTEHGPERSMIPNTGANATLRAEHLPQTFDEPDGHLYVSGYALFTGAREAALEAMRRARAQGLTLSVGTASAEPLRDVGAETFFGWIGTDLLLIANRDEAAALTGETEPASARAALAQRVGRAIVTCGADGAIWCTPQETLSFPSVAAPSRFIDPVGAGDAFTAGVLRVFALGGSAAAAVQVGNQLAARCVSTPGGRP
jgi:sugar/nucleoside kinase (ribokinase family)